MELKLLSVQAAAERLGIHPKNLYRAAESGELDCIPVMGAQVVFTEAALDEWIRRRAEQGNAVVADERGLVECADVAQVAGIAVNSVTNWIRQGKARGVKVRGKWWLTWDEARRVAREKGFLQQLEDLERRRRVA